MCAVERAPCVQWCIEPNVRCACWGGGRVCVCACVCVCVCVCLCMHSAAHSARGSLRRRWRRRRVLIACGVVSVARLRVGGS